MSQVNDFNETIRFYEEKEKTLRNKAMLIREEKAALKATIQGLDDREKEVVAKIEAMGLKPQDLKKYVASSGKVLAKLVQDLEKIMPETNLEKVVAVVEEETHSPYDVNQLPPLEDDHI